MYTSATWPTWLLVSVRSWRRSRVNANHQDSTAPNRLRNPVMKAMWMNSQPHQPMKPDRCTLPADITAEPREMYAADPRSW